MSLSKNLLRASLCLVLTLPAFSADFVPKPWFEDVPATDDSVQRCFVVRTQAGVRYTVESGNDLTGWAEEDEIYGLGHEFTVAMHEFTPPPPPPPGNPNPVPPAPVKNASLLIRPCSGEDGGTLVAWKSLDHGGPVSVVVDREMVEEWEQVPFFWNRYGNFHLFIARQPLDVPPPDANSPLGTLDTAVLAAFEANFADMNVEVADSVARSRNSPPPEPPDPAGRKFWRLKVDATLDTDGDGCRDVNEFQIAARAAGGGAQARTAGNAARGDSFNPDTNFNGIPDGEELDGDEDGTFDAFDSDPGDDTATVDVTPLPRYALFPTTGAAPPEWRKEALQISDKGTVLFENGTWSGGEWTPLVTGGGSLTGGYARGINDHDGIIGGGIIELSADPLRAPSVIFHWPNPDAAPAAVSIENVYASPSYSFSYGLLYPGPVFSNDGDFISGAFSWADGEVNGLPNGAWTAASGDQPAARGVETTPWTHWVGANGWKWGFDYPVDENNLPDFQTPRGLVQAPGPLPLLPFIPRNVLQTPGAIIAIPAPYEDQAAQAYINGSWKPAGAYASALDIAADGTAIGRNQSGLIAPVWLNGKWTGIHRVAPDVPSDWKEGGVRLIDTTPGGWILARRGEDPGIHNAVMLPLKAEARYIDSLGAVATRASGVDDFSIVAPVPGDAVKERIWIVASTTTPRAVKITSPVHAAHPLKISGSGLDFGGTGGEGSISGPETILNLTAGGAASGQDIPLDLKFGEFDSLSKPLGVKVIKNRTLRVTVYKVIKQTSGQPDNPPAVFPEESTLENFLNDIYKPQLNLTVDIKIETTPLTLDWDIAPADGVLDATKVFDTTTGIQQHNAEQNNVIAARNNLPEDNANISIYILGSGQLIGRSAWGDTVPDQRTCWVVGEAGEGRTILSHYRTIAHEIGHVLVGPGHPDQNTGAAPLGGGTYTDHTRRMMCSGERAGKFPGTLLVKEEWDKAEEWMQEEESVRPMNP